MKTLYESILDDEDVLVKDTKEYSNNPFLIIQALFNEYSYKEVKRKMDYIDKVLKPIKDQFMKYSKIKKNELRFDISESYISNDSYSLKFYTFHDGSREDMLTFDFTPHSTSEIFCFKSTFTEISGYLNILNGVSKFLINKYNFKQKYLKDTLVLEL